MQYKSHYLSHFLCISSRNPRLASLISHISPESLNVGTVENTIDCKAAITAVKTKRTSEVVRFSDIQILEKR